MNAKSNVLKLQPNVAYVLKPQFKDARPVDGQFGPQFLYTFADDKGVEWKYYASDFVNDLLQSADYWDDLEGSGEWLCLTKQVDGSGKTRWDLKIQNNGAWQTVKMRRNATDTEQPAAQAAQPIVPPSQPVVPQQPSAGPLDVRSSGDGDVFRAMEDLMVQAYIMANAVIYKVQRCTDTGDLDPQTIAHCFFIEANKKGLKAVGRPDGGGMAVPTPSQPAVEQAAGAAGPANNSAGPTGVGHTRYETLQAFLKQVYAAGVTTAQVDNALAPLGMGPTMSAEELAQVPADNWRKLPPLFTRLSMSARQGITEAVANAIDGEVVTPPQPVAVTDDLPF